MCNSIHLQKCKKKTIVYMWAVCTLSNIRHDINWIRCIQTNTQQEHLSDLLNLQQTPDGDNDNHNDGDDVFYLITVIARSSHFLRVISYFLYAIGQLTHSQHIDGLPWPCVPMDGPICCKSLSQAYMVFLHIII